MLVHWLVSLPLTHRDGRIEMHHFLFIFFQTVLSVLALVFRMFDVGLLTDGF